MNKIFKPVWLPFFTIIAGIVGFGLRLWLFMDGMDEKQLISADHPAGILVLVLTAVVLAVVALCVISLKPVNKFSKLFPASMFAGIGCVAAAVGILYVDVRDLVLKQDIITVATMLVGLVAAAALLILGWCRWKGNRPSFWLQVAVTVYFMLHLVSQYRLWSAEPQLQIYFFPLMASLCLMLTAYRGAVLDAEKKAGRRFYAFFNQAGLFFCCLSLQGSSWPFYLAMALWLATGLCSMKTYKAAASESEAG